MRTTEFLEGYDDGEVTRPDVTTMAALVTAPKAEPAPAKKKERGEKTIPGICGVCLRPAKQCVCDDFPQLRPARGAK